MNETVAAIAALQVMMLFVMIWQGIHLLVTNHRIKVQRRVLANHERALVSLTVMGLLTDSDWERGERVRRRREVTIEPSIPVSGHTHLQWTGQPARYRQPGVPDHYERWPKPPTVGPVGGAGNSGARDV